MMQPCYLHHCAKAADAGSISTWWDEEGPPQLLVTSHISDLPRHVDESSCNRGHSPEVKDPKKKKKMFLNLIFHYLNYTNFIFLQWVFLLLLTWTNAASKHLQPPALSLTVPQVVHISRASPANQESAWTLSTCVCELLWPSALDFCTSPACIICLLMHISCNRIYSLSE